MFKNWQFISIYHRIVGMGGIWQSLVLVAFCGACTFLTGLSLSAIATNGAMKVCWIWVELVVGEVSRNMLQFAFANQWVVLCSWNMWDGEVKTWNLTNSKNI